MKLRTRLVTAASSLTLLVAPCLAGAATWTIDPAHSEVGFKVRHMMISNVRGTFGEFEGTVEYDRTSPASATIDVTIKAASIDTGVEKRDNHLRSADFFDVDTFPTLTFRSTAVESTSPGSLRLRGDLTLHGVTREVVLDVDGPSEEVKDPWGKIKVGAFATTTINRKDFGLTWNKALEAGGVLVGEEVTINLDIQLVKQAEAAAQK